MPVQGTKSLTAIWAHRRESVRWTLMSHCQGVLFLFEGPTLSTRHCSQQDRPIGIPEGSVWIIANLHLQQPLLLVLCLIRLDTVTWIISVQSSCCDTYCRLAN